MKIDVTKVCILLASGAVAWKFGFWCGLLFLIFAAVMFDD